MKEKRKARLDTTEFIGFSAFAATPAQSQLSPVYTGTHEGLASQFARVTQKKDANTKVKALKEIEELLGSDGLHRKVQIGGLQHWMWIYHKQLYYDDASSVRHACLRVLVATWKRTPKAMETILREEPEVGGMLWTSQTDPATEVRQLAAESGSECLQSCSNAEGLAKLTRRILGYGRSSAFYQDTSSRGGGSLSESQQEVVDERYERLVSTVLQACEAWILQREETLALDENWIQTMRRPQIRVRKHAYQLASVALSASKKGDAVDDRTESILQALTQAVSTEKEASNWPALLAAILSYWAHVEPSDSLLPAKALRKACYGAPSHSWASSLLPLTGHSPNPLRLLQSAWEGRGLVLGSSLPLLRGLAESAAHCVVKLLKADAMETWLAVWSSIMGLPTMSSGSDDAIRELAQNLIQFSKVSIDLSGVSMDSTTSYTIVAFLEVYDIKKSPVLLESLVARIRELWKPFESSSGSVPPQELYNAMDSVFEHIGAKNVLGDELERFVASTLLRWTMLHTSILSEHGHNEDLVKGDFRLLAHSLNELDTDHQRKMFAMIIGELARGQCDYNFLGVGLREYVSRTSEAKVVASVLSEWEEIPGGGGTIPRQVVDVLLDMVSPHGASIDDDTMIDILIGTWTEDTSVLDSNCHLVSLVSTKPPFVRKLLERASRVCCDRVAKIAGNSFVERELLQAASNWSELAASLIKGSWSLFDSDECSLATVGLADKRVWEASPRSLFLLLIELLVRIEGDMDKTRVVLETPGHASLIPKVLLLLSDHENDRSELVSTVDRILLFLTRLGSADAMVEAMYIWADRILEHLGEVILSGEDQQGVALQLSIILSKLLDAMLPPTEIIPLDLIQGKELKEGDEVLYIRNPDVPTSREPAIIVKTHFDVQAGYYFTVRLGDTEKQTVASRLRHVHSSESDEPASDEDSLSTQRRGALRDRLKDIVLSTCGGRPEYAELTSLLAGHVGLETSRGIGTLHYQLFKNLDSLLSSVSTDVTEQRIEQAVQKLWHVVLSLGYGLHVRSFPWLSSLFRLDLMKVARVLVSHEDTLIASPDLGVAALAFSWCIWKSESLLDEANVPLLTKFYCTAFRVSRSSALEWIPSRQVFDLLFSSMAFIASHYSILRSDQPCGMSTMLSLVQKCLTDTIGWIGRGKLVDEDTITTYLEVSRGLVRNDPLVVYMEEVMRASWTGPIDKWSAKACVSHVPHLCRSVYCTRWRRIAFEGLYRSVGVYGSLLSPESPLVERDSSGWIEGLEDEEADDVEEDLRIVCAWLPEVVMDELESLRQEDFNEIDDNESFGRCLIWLVTLRIIDEAAPKDFRHRPAFVSYLTRCGAVGPMLNLALLNESSVNNSRGKKAPMFASVEEIFSTNEVMNLPHVSSLVLSRTIEVLPAVSRRWWEEECPAVYTSTVQTFVEKHVAPTLLRHEIERIKAATSFGSMQVAASEVSRQAVAVYEQDDFKLTAKIYLPPSFPFRNAEVDCSKTLGVPASRWNRWNLQITLLLNREGGTLQDARKYERKRRISSLAVNQPHNSCSYALERERRPGVRRS